jgi:two-component system, cell cycle response regulator CpdR
MTRQTVLFVDDEVALRALVGGALEDEDYDVTQARSGVEALGLLRRGEVFDFIVSDVSMPDGVSGVELAHHAQSLQSQARIILVSGHPRAQLDPFPPDVAFLAKPYRLGQLLELLRKPG